MSMASGMKDLLPFVEAVSLLVAPDDEVVVDGGAEKSKAVLVAALERLLPLVVVGSTAAPGWGESQASWADGVLTAFRPEAAPFGARLPGRDWKACIHVSICNVG
jgi:hypothetical protein